MKTFLNIVIGMLLGYAIASYMLSARAQSLDATAEVVQDLPPSASSTEMMLSDSMVLANELFSDYDTVENNRILMGKLNYISHQVNDAITACGK